MKNTDQERALYECISCNHLYGVAPSACDCCENPKNEYREWVAFPKEQATRRAQVVQSVAGIQGGVIRGNPKFPKPTAPKAAPQPPEEALVQLPELLRKLRISAKRDGELGRDSRRTDEIEQQVRQLLAAKGAK